MKCRLWFIVSYECNPCMVQQLFHCKLTTGQTWKLFPGECCVIIGIRVAALLSGIANMKLSPVSRLLPPKIHCCGRCLPWWFLRLVKRLSSISTIVLGSPITIQGCVGDCLQIPHGCTCSNRSLHTSKLPTHAHRTWCYSHLLAPTVDE